MSIATALQNLSNDITSARSSIVSKGGTVTVDGGSSQLATDIGTITALNGTTLSITPSTSAQSFTPTSPYNAYTSVSATAVTSSIDANIQPENIKKDVTILGVTGTLEGGGGSGKKFGITAEDFWYTYPNDNQTLDTTAPHCDMSSVNNVNVAYYYTKYFSCARIKSLNTPVINELSTYIFQEMIGNNRCIQYLKVNIGISGLSIGNAFYNVLKDATNLKVLVYKNIGDINILIRASNYRYLCGTSTNTLKIKSFRFETLTYSYGNNSTANFAQNSPLLQTIWLPKLSHVGTVTNGQYGMFANGCNGCKNLLAFFAPRLNYIGYSSNTATQGGYGQFSNFFVDDPDNKMDTLYFPWLIQITNGNSTVANGTFYGCTGIKKFYAPRLTTIKNNGGVNCFANTGITEFHFGKSNKASIEASPGYATLWGRGAGNATVYFDLVLYITTSKGNYIRQQDDDYMTYLVYNGKTYYRDDASRTQHNIDWQFWAWKSNDNEIVYTQNPVALVGEAVWQYVSNGDDWDYNDIGNVEANDWKYAWSLYGQPSIYTNNQYTPAVGDRTYVVSADGKSWVEDELITATS